MVTIAFKSFDSFKQFLNSLQTGADRIKPDRFYVTNASGAVKKVAVVGAAGRVLLEYSPANLPEILPNDPWLKADPENDILAAVEVKDIGESI